MATRKNSTTQTATKKAIDYTYTIDRTYTLEGGTIIFDATVNGIKLYGMRVINGEKGDFVAYPSIKSNKYGKYYKHYFLEMTEEQADAFIQAVFDKADA